VTKDELQSRIAAINNEMIQTKANYAKLEGHLGEAQHWLTEVIDKENKESADGQTNEQAEECAASEGLCGAEGAEVPCE